MTSTDFLMIVAVLLSPLLAVQVQKLVESWKEHRGRQLAIFRTLMATRAAIVSPAHVEALNLIDLEFSADKRVLEAWRLYLDHLSSGPSNGADPNIVNQLQAWDAKRQDLLVDLLDSMGKRLRYSFDRVHLKKGVYSPRVHAETEAELTLFRKEMLKLLTGKQPLFVKPFPDPAQSKP